MAISRDFWHFFHFECIFEEETQGHPETQVGPPNEPWESEIWPSKVSILTETMREGHTKNCIFSTFGF
jgi:hypothetical protein